MDKIPVLGLDIIERRSSYPFYLRNLKLVTEARTAGLIMRNLNRHVNKYKGDSDFIGKIK